MGIGVGVGVGVGVDVGVGVGVGVGVKVATNLNLTASAMMALLAGVLPEPLSVIVLLPVLKGYVPSFTQTRLFWVWLMDACCVPLAVAMLYGTDVARLVPAR